MTHVALLSDDEAWEASTPHGLDASLWSFIFLTILWRLWESRNGEVFRNETSCHRVVLLRVYDDLVIWRKRLPVDLANSLVGWHAFLRGCITNSTAHSR